MSLSLLILSLFFIGKGKGRLTVSKFTNIDICNNNNKNEVFKKDKQDFLNKLKKGIKKDTIFISIASYRDVDCSNTVNSIYNNAKYPNNIYLGICEQNSDNIQEECIDKNFKYNDNIKKVRLSYKEAKGPTYARYICSNLWDCQQYFFQIDSHTEFIKDWDILLIKMIEQCRKNNLPETEYAYNINGSVKPVIGSYPPDKNQLTIDGYTIVDEYKILNTKLPMLYSHFYTDKKTKPIKNPHNLCGANFLFCDYTILIDVPFDPNLPYLFQGEEYLLSARLYSHGYDIYAPNIKICSHFYKRPGPLYWKDNSEMYNLCITSTHNRVKDILNGVIQDNYSLGPRKFSDIKI